MNIAVYLGSSEGNNPIYREAAVELGRCIGQHGFRLIFGGSRGGLMGALADAVSETGGRVTGVETRAFIDAGLASDDLDELIITDTMAERKTRMISLCDACIAFPGGIGTLDEISEVIVLDSLSLIKKPYVIYNVNGYYDSLRQFFDRARSDGFLSEEKYRAIHFASSLSEVLNALNYRD